MGARIAVGERQRSLIVVAKVGFDKNRNVLCECKCDCGRTVTMSGNSFRTQGRCVECSKLSGAAKRTKHGGAKREGRDPLYSAYKGMLTRCENPKSRNYRWYGAKGIKVCEDWRADFDAFRAWALANGWAPGLTLDRVDETKGYEPGNCAYETQSENSRRMRASYEFVRVAKPEYEPGITQWL